jgi:hypothetical protein
MNLAERFATLDENLKLDPDERARAQEVHNLISDILIRAGIAKRTRLQGSLARKTMLPPLHDIDKVIELVDDLMAQFSGLVGPLRVMDLIRSVISEEIPNATFEVRMHALGIVLPDDGFDFDAVPAFNPEDGSGWIKIANTHASGVEDAWKPSNTYQLIETVSARNVLCGGRFVRQVRMAKQIVETAGLSKALPGLHVETFAYFAITEATAHPQAVGATLAKAYELIGGSYTDPTGEDQISDRLENWTVMATHNTLGGLATSATRALELAANGDETGAAHVWADLFGENFPRPTDAQEKTLLTGLYAGRRLSPNNSLAPSTRAWRP